MKKIEALINPDKLQTVKQELYGIGMESLTAFEAKESRRHGNRSLVFRGTEFIDEFPPMTKIEIMVADEMVESAVAIIIEAAKTAKGNNAKVFVSTVEEAFLVRAQRHEHRALHA